MAASKLKNLTRVYFSYISFTLVLLFPMHENWINEQLEGSKKVIKYDDFVSPLTLIGGLDISFVDQSDGVEEFEAVGALVILDYKTLKLLYMDCLELKTRIPYVSGFLGFREEPFAKLLFNRLRENAPQLIPQVLVVDGCGIYHPRGYGSASQIGVNLNIPTIGLSKSFLKLNGLNEDDYIICIENNYKHDFELQITTTEHGVIASALYTGKSKHPRCYVSIGHRISLPSAVEIIKKCSMSKIPEPIRQADLISREYIRKRKMNK